MSELAGTVFWNRTAHACTSHHRWNLQKRREWKLPTSKLMTELCAIPASHRGCQGSAKSTDGAHLRKMALPKIQYGSHVNCQPGEENRGAITEGAGVVCLWKEVCSQSCSTRAQTHVEESLPWGGHSRKSSGLLHRVLLWAAPRSQITAHRLLYLLTHLAARFRLTRELTMGEGTRCMHA